MGTGFDIATPEEEEGIIPRAVTHLFEGIDQRKSDAKQRNEPLPDFKVTVQFMEVGNTVGILLKIFLVQKWHRMLKIGPNFHYIKKRNNNLLLTEREGRTGEYWPEVVAVWTEHSEVRTKTTEGQYSLVRLEQVRLVSSLLYGTLFLIVKCTSGGLHLN